VRKALQGRWIFDARGKWNMKTENTAIDYQIFTK
jgi:hypothetical protein